MDPRIHYLSPLLIALTGFSFFALGLFLQSCVVLALSFLVFFQVRHLLNTSRPQINNANVAACSNRPKIFSSIDELASGIAHEINNPLAIIAQESHWGKKLLQKISADPEDFKNVQDCTDSFAEIESQVHRCNQIVQKLLSMARELNIVIQKIDINELVRKIYEIAKREPSTSNITLNLQLDPKVPLINSDAPLIQQVLLNVVMNAKQAVGEKGTIDLRTKLTGNNLVEIEIQDNGCGIPKENLDRIFLPFFSTKQCKNGTGLGLSICKGIVEKLGGSITVKSKFNEGTLFRIRLPIST